MTATRAPAPMLRSRALTALLAVALALAACNGGDDPDPPAAERIGPAGGSITSADGRLTLTFPSGALASETEVTVAPRAVADLPEAYRQAGATAAYELTPDGLQFAQPVSATFAVDEADGGPTLPGGLLLTDGAGGPVPLDGPGLEVDSNGDVIASGTLAHFTPLVYTPTGLATELTVTGVPEEALTVGETFQADVAVTFDADASTVVDEVSDVRYHDLSDRPIACTEAGCDDAPLPGDGASFTGTFAYTCTEAGAGRYAGDVTLDATAGSDAFEVTLGVARFLDCDPADEEPPAEEQARVVPLPGDGVPGPPVRVGYPFELFDVSVPSGAEPPETLFAVLTADGTLRAYDETLAQRDTIFLGNDYFFASAAVSYTFEGSEGSERQDGLVLGGADGGVLLQRFGDIGSTTGVASANVTDAYGIGAYAGYDLAETVAIVEYGSGIVHMYGPDPETGGYAETDASGVIDNSDVGNQALISGWISPEGWDEPGDVAWMLANPAPMVNDENGWVWSCSRTENGAVGAACQQVAEVGRNPVNIGAAEPDAEGDTVVAVSSYDDETIDLLVANVLDGKMTPLDSIEDAQGVSMAVARDPEQPEDVLVAGVDRNADQLVGARVHADGTVEVKRIAAPLPGSDPDNPDAACRRPEHVNAYVAGSILRLFATCGGNESDSAVLVLLAYKAAFGGL